MAETNGGTKAAWILATGALAFIGGMGSMWMAQPKDVATKSDVQSLEQQIDDLKAGTAENTASIERLNATVAKIGEHVKLNQ